MSAEDARTWLEDRGYDVIWQAWTPERGGFEVESSPDGTLVHDALFEEDGRLRVFVEPPERYQARPEDCDERRLLEECAAPHRGSRLSRVHLRWGSASRRLRTDVMAETGGSMRRVEAERMVRTPHARESL